MAQPLQSRYVIKTLIFDLGNVIVPFDFKLGYTKLASLCSYPAEEIPVRIRSTGLVQPFETGEITPEHFVRELTSTLGLRATYAEFCDLWTSVFLPDTLISEALFARFAGTHRLLLLSNTNPIHFSMIRANYPVLRHFDDYVLSYEVRSAKPDSKIYQEALARSGCRPEECFFTDDLLINVEAARQHGMDAVQFQSASQLETELRTRGLL